MTSQKKKPDSYLSQNYPKDPFGEAWVGSFYPF